MSKSRNLFLTTGGGIAVVLASAYGLAGQMVAPMPDTPRQFEAEAQIVAQVPTLPAPEAAPERAPEPAQMAAQEPAPTAPALAPLGLGRTALPEEIAAWDVNVMPDGRGLPEGSGNAYDGEALFEDNCASCHGSFAEGVDNWPKLAGGRDTLADEDPLKTVGSYWPYLSTVWDYVHRSMPFGNAQSLSDDDVYAIVAYILYSNDLIDDTFELSRDSFLEVEMPNAGNFIVDDRAEAEYGLWRTEPCMSACKDSVEITMRATVLDVTPETEAEMGAETAPETVAAPDPLPETESAPAPAPATAAAPATPDPALIASGERVFRKCKACHQVGAGAQSRTGPHLNGLLERPVGSVAGFKYSGAMAAMGGVWDTETLAAFLADPRGVVKGTRMAFAGLKSPDDVAAVIAYLRASSP